MSEAEHIHIDEEETKEDAKQEKVWTEEFVAAGNELVDMVKKLVHETNVRRIVVKNEARRIHLELPLLVGIAGIALLPVYAALALIAALAVDCTIMVERVEKAPKAETAES